MVKRRPLRRVSDNLGDISPSGQLGMSDGQTAYSQMLLHLSAPFVTEAFCAWSGKLAQVASLLYADIHVVTPAVDAVTQLPPVLRLRGRTCQP